MGGEITHRRKGAFWRTVARISWIVLVYAWVILELTAQAFLVVVLLFVGLLGIGGHFIGGRR